MAKFLLHKLKREALGIRSFEMDLDVRLLHGVAAEIPAGRVASVREEAVHAGLRRGRIEDQFAFAIFMKYRVVVLDAYCTKGLVVGGDAIAKDGVVGGIGECETNYGH